MRRRSLARSVSYAQAMPIFSRPSIRKYLKQSEGEPDKLLLYVDQWEELYAQAPPSSDESEPPNMPLTSIASSTCC